MSEDPLDLLLLKSPSTHHAAASTEREDELMVQLQDAKMYAAALEFKLLESRTHTDHVKETLLRELMVYKREHLQDRTSQLYEAGLQSTLTRVATSDKEYVNHSRTLQSKIDVGSDRCKRLTSIVMTLKEKMTLNEQAHADAMRVQSTQHREQVDQLEAEALQLRTRIVACTGRRFVEKCAVAKTQLAELRDNLREVRGTLVHFQQEIASGVVARRRSTLRGERWNRSTSATSSSFRALGNRSGSRSGGEGKSPLRNGQRQSAVNLMNPGDIQRTNTVVFHTDDVQDVTGDDTPESSSPNTVCPPNNNNNNNTIGMMGRIMNVITTAAEQQQKVEAREKILVNMFEGLMPLLDPRSAMLWEQSRRSPDDLELLKEASTSASEHLRSELETLQKKCATLTAANASLDKDRMALARQCDTLRQQIPEKKQLIAAPWTRQIGNFSLVLPRWDLPPAAKLRRVKQLSVQRLVAVAMKRRTNDAHRLHNILLLLRSQPHSILNFCLRIHRDQKAKVLVRL